MLQAVVVGTPLPGHERPVLDLDDAGVDLGLERRAPVVGAAVVVEVEALGALEAVEGDPLRQVAGLVAEDRADREGDRRACTEGAGPALPDIVELASPSFDATGPRHDRGGHELSETSRHSACRFARRSLSSWSNRRIVLSHTVSGGSFIFFKPGSRLTGRELIFFSKASRDLA